ncbi:MAG: hypothetical protein WDN10_02575 [bacterium]
MSWAARRRFWILGGLIALAAVLAAAILFAAVYRAPSCTDTKQNQGEEGVDCGGPCPYLCAVKTEAPVVQFVRALSPRAGRTDVIAYVENQNPSAAARSAPYRIDLYGAGNVIIASSNGTVDLPPKSVVPVYVPNFFSGNQQVVRVFLTFDQDSVLWESYRETRVLPKARSAELGGTPDAPRITAVLQNDDVEPLYNTKVVATVFDASGNAVGASQTVLEAIQPQGSASAIFTWNAAFPAPVARIEVKPVIMLPR